MCDAWGCDSEKFDAFLQMLFRTYARKHQKRNPGCGVDGEGLRAESCVTGEREWQEAEKLQEQVSSNA
jgi:hypothetical protein